MQVLRLLSSTQHAVICLARCNQKASENDLSPDKQAVGLPSGIIGCVVWLYLRLATRSRIHCHAWEDHPCGICGEFTAHAYLGDMTWVEGCRLFPFGGCCRCCLVYKTKLVCFLFRLVHALSIAFCENTDRQHARPSSSCSRELRCCYEPQPAACQQASLA